MKISSAQETNLDVTGLLQDPLTHRVEIIGKPQLLPNGIGFGGTDGLLIHKNIMPKAREFSISVKFNPSGMGPWQQRFFHIQDLHSQDRFLMEIRMESDRTWYADTFFQSGDHHCILQDRNVRFPADQWYDYKATYDGRVLSHSINQEGVMSDSFPNGRLPDESGCGLGIRWNKIYPFVGIIQSVRLTWNSSLDQG